MNFAIRWINIICAVGFAFFLATVLIFVRQFTRSLESVMSSLVRRNWIWYRFSSRRFFFLLFPTSPGWWIESGMSKWSIFENAPFSTSFLAICTHLFAEKILMFARRLSAVNALWTVCGVHTHSSHICSTVQVNTTSKFDLVHHCKSVCLNGFAVCVIVFPFSAIRPTDVRACTCRAQEEGVRRTFGRVRGREDWM